jgi:hypothetical protein
MDLVRNERQGGGNPRAFTENGKVIEESLAVLPIKRYKVLGVHEALRLHMIPGWPRVVGPTPLARTMSCRNPRS